MPQWPGRSGRAARGSLWRGALACVFLWCFADTAFLQGAETPMEAVRETITQVLRILDDPSLKNPAKQAQRRHMLEEIAAGRFDYAEMSKRVLGSYWKPLTETQRKEFVEVYKGFLSDRYAGKIEDYSGQKQEVGYLTERIEGSYAEVRTELRSDKTTLPMDYRLLMKDGRWSAYDIIIDGVSLVSNYRSQFQKIIRESSYEELLKKLRERTVTEETKKKKAS
ncbi:MAG: Phospholipid ABC transporter shuttle protein MlaC [Nitrospira sp.]|nr:Phospholipid ABC transporter shuttle protein MlaC [Nitrospira sp.]